MCALAFVAIAAVLSVLSVPAAAEASAAPADVDRDEPFHAVRAFVHDHADDVAGQLNSGLSGGIQALSSCYDTTGTDPAGDSSGPDVVTYQVSSDCSTWAVDVVTADDWRARDLDVFGMSVDADYNATTGCSGGDYLAAAFYDAGLVGAMIRTPHCDEATWTYVDRDHRIEDGGHDRCAVRRRDDQERRIVPLVPRSQFGRRRRRPRTGQDVGGAQPRSDGADRAALAHGDRRREARGARLASAAIAWWDEGHRLRRAALRRRWTHVANTRRRPPHQPRGHRPPAHQRPALPVPRRRGQPGRARTVVGRRRRRARSRRPPPLGGSPPLAPTGRSGSLGWCHPRTVVPRCAITSCSARPTAA